MSLSRRGFRKLFRSTVAVLVVALHVVFFVSGKYATIYSPRPGLEFAISAGRFCAIDFAASSGWTNSGPGSLGWRVAHNNGLGRYGFIWDQFGIGRSILIFPLWPLLLLGIGVLALTEWRDLRKRSPIGVCLHCGYDLRATPDRCPECGAAAVAKRAHP